jgi:hypothetical protein
MTISTGLPIQKSMSMSADFYNIEGDTHDGEVAKVTVRMADQYGNPVSNGTTVNFVTEGGAIGTSAQGACQTVDGACTVPLVSQNFRPVDGRVTVLAFAQGIPTFVDANGDGQYNCTTYSTPAGASATTVYRPLVDTCVSGGEDFEKRGDAFLDTNVDGTYDGTKGDLPFPYGHVGYSAELQKTFGITYIRTSQEFVFSGSVPFLKRQFCSNGVCRDWLSSDGDAAVIAGLAGAGCSAQTLVFRVYDAHNNTLPANTVVTSVDADKVAPGTMSPDKVPSNASNAGTIHTVTIKPEATCAAGSFSVSVKTPLGAALLFPFKSN